MKKFLSILVLVALAMFIATPAMAEVGLNKQNVWNAHQIFKHGITVYGQDIVPSPQFSKVWYVCSVGGADTMGNDYGKSYDKPFATLNYAVGQCRAGYGDVIFVLPSHNEGITTAAEIDFDVAGIFVIGLGTGEDRPTIDFDAQAASVAVGASNITIDNIRFRVSANAVTVGLDIEAGFDFTHVTNCEFGYAETATDEFAISLRNNAGCDGTVIDNCLFSAGAQAAVVGVSITGASDDVTISYCRFLGAFSTSCINGITTLSTNLLIEKNLFYQGATEPAIELLTNTTGLIRDNDVKTNLATMIASVVADACYLFRNYYNEDVNPGTGTIMGAASADD